jgi:signal transduction histidine kinase
VVRVRFDDMFATVLAMPTPGSVQYRAKWLQLTDLLGQRGDRAAPKVAAAALRNLAQIKPHVDPAIRAQAARAVGPRVRFAPLVAFYAHDNASVAREMLMLAQLDDVDWINLLPGLSPLSRSFIRRRQDLSPAVVQALSQFGSTDFALPSADPIQEAEQQKNPNAADQISELVQRIESFRAAREAQKPAPQPLADAQITPLLLSQFGFETGPDGLIRSVHGVRRGTIIGLSIAEAAYGDEPGTDAYSAGAFRQRSEIVNARLRLDGDDTIKGEWRYSAVPRFDAESGQFQGYSGRARRPQIGESAQLLNAAADKPQAASTDSLRQILHELKTPLNAIAGFAQIIEGQFFGPVSNRYRAMASNIRDDADHLQSLFDDLDTLVRKGEGVSSDDSTDARAMLLHISQSLQSLTDTRRVDLIIGMGEAAIPVAISQRTAFRLYMRLIAGLIDAAESGEVLRANLAIGSALPSRAEFSISLPMRLQGLSRDALMDPDHRDAPDQQDTPRLALGFSLRLIDALAAEKGGELYFAPERLLLALPLAQTLAEISEVQR